MHNESANEEDNAENPYLPFVADIATTMPSDLLSSVKELLLHHTTLSYEICQLEKQKRKRKKHRTSVDSIVLDHHGDDHGDVKPHSGDEGGCPSGESGDSCEQKG
jgi:hypothetical protein